MASLHKKGMENIRLFLIGFDTAMTSSQIETLIDDAGIKDITRISGKRDDVNACISAVDIGVVASLWSEAIARSALEIMAVDRPLVSTDVGVMPDLVCPSAMVGPGDVKALADAIESIVNSDELRSEILEAQKRTMSQLTLEEFLKRSLNLYHSLIDDK
ncbi:hypothetical protein PSDVSF_07160 [Pseudodesulfovibrio sediminis]|uniref:Glycosyl transferase family 1 domain-containing protein n=1 Tax=Pseudodesulfovibrio sediminis TaxID=2810563 RepID=A0ABM7P3R2_9BACT|nr:hypothetical protein PSDVSF_07160 [Pseudodesulfovibrio sediminis]